MKTVIPVIDNDVLKATRAFLRSLIEKGVVEAIYVPLETEGGAVLPALVTDPMMLERANLLAPVMPINGRAPCPRSQASTRPPSWARAPPVRDSRADRAGEVAASQLGGLTLIGSLRGPSM
jgi:hypothetical protein